MVTTSRPLTIAEFHELVEAQPDTLLELEPDGSVFEEAPGSVSLGHSFLQPRLAALLDAQRRGLVFTELNVEWSERPEYRADIVFYAAARAPELRDPTSRTGWRFHARVPPDLEIEIRSPDQSRRRLQNKCSWYVQHGVAVAWLVDLDDHTITVFQAEVAGVIVHDRDDDRPLPMPEALRGLALRCADVFQLLEPGG